MKKLLFVLLLFTTSCFAQQPSISIIIDDLGNNLHTNIRAVNLPGPVVASILPHRPYALFLDKLAQKKHKEVIVHTPMQAIAPLNMGPGGLSATMNHEEFVKVLNYDLDSLPYKQGMNNHMGSLLTQSPQDMDWIMENLQNTNLFFVDSLTTNQSVAAEEAGRYHIPHIKRDVFLDDVHQAKYIDKQFKELIKIAKRYGTALAIGHPFPETLAYLQKHIPELEKEGVELVSVRELIRRQSVSPVGA